MANGEKNHGDATADRIRERTRQERDRMELQLRATFEDADMPTHPQIVLMRSEPPPSIPVLRHLPKNTRPYVIGAVAALALTGFGLRDELGALLRVILIAPEAPSSPAKPTATDRPAE